MRRARTVPLFVVLFGSCCDVTSAQVLPPSEAAEAFAMAREISDDDGDRTWGIRICGPILFADPKTSEAVANQADTDGRLQPSGAVWTGKLPKEIHVANTAVEWAGVRWTMVMWPLPSDTRRRAQLIAHECYHRIQAELGLPATDVVNSHLEGKDGRTWLLLEWRALERALLERGAKRRSEIGAALRFRSHRRSLSPSAASNENQLEMNEGLAEYTGVRLANPREADRRAASIFLLRDGPGRTSFARSFAYVSGPAYGVLLDEATRHAGVSSKDLCSPCR